MESLLNCLMMGVITFLIISLISLFWMIWMCKTAVEGKEIEGVGFVKMDPSEKASVSDTLEIDSRRGRGGGNV